MDTCHIHDAGYDVIGDFDGVLRKFDDIIGLDRLAVVHINDSKNPLGAAKDRHAPIGSGWIGFEAISRIVRHEALQDKPFVLETPWIGQKGKERPMYEVEIALLRGDVEERFGGEFLTDVERLHHFFKKNDIDSREYVLSTWELLKSDAKARKADPREPLERLYDMATEHRILSGDYSEEAINHRLTAYLAGEKYLAQL